MTQGSPLFVFLQSLAEDPLRDRSEVRTHLPKLINSLGFDDYSLDSDAAGSIADAIALPHIDHAPVLAFEFGYDPEVDSRGPYLPHRPSHVDYPTQDQILSETSADYVISLSNDSLAVRGESYAKTIVFQEADQSLEKIPTYTYLTEEAAEDIILELHPGRTRNPTHTEQSSFSDF